MSTSLAHEEIEMKMIDTLSHNTSAEKPRELAWGAYIPYIVYMAVIDCIVHEPVTRATHGLSSMLFFVNVSYSEVILFRKPHISKTRRPRGGASWR